MTFRVAAVSFLNTVPLIDWFADQGQVPVALTRALPSRLAALLAAGEADAGLLPVVDIFQGAGTGLLSPTGIACTGAVDTVKVYARGPLPELQRVAVDRGSHTSVALLRILLAELHGIRPPFQVVQPDPGRLPGPHEATLVIGDTCFAFDRRLRRIAPDDGGAGDLAVHDLGALWRTMTGLPFVFAAWTASPAFAQEADPARRRELGRLLTLARDHGLQRLDGLAAREAAAGKLGPGGEATAATIAHYFRSSLHYVLGDQEMAGLRRFHELCLAHGLAAAGPCPELLP